MVLHYEQPGSWRGCDCAHASPSGQPGSLVALCRRRTWPCSGRRRLFGTLIAARALCCMAFHSSFYTDPTFQRVFGLCYSISVDLLDLFCLGFSLPNPLLLHLLLCSVKMELLIKSDCNCQSLLFFIFSPLSFYSSFYAKMTGTWFPNPYSTPSPLVS